MRTRRHNYTVKAKQHRQNQAPIPNLASQPTQEDPPQANPIPTESSPEQNQENQSQEKSSNTSSEDNVNKKLQELYDDITKTPSFSAKIAEFLRKHELHSKHRRIIKRKFPRRRVIARFPFEIFMADLIEYPKYKFQNKGFVYILLLIDCFTRKIYLAPMKKKDMEHSAAAFEKIFKSFDQFPVNLVTDGGKEFFNSATSKVFLNYGINHYKTPTRTQWKASMAERAIQTIKNRLHKYFVLNGNKAWINVIDQVALNYNNTPHSAHNMAPQDVTDENRDQVYKKLFPDKQLTTVCKLKEGDKVRALKEKTQFEKGYTQKWSDEIYKIKSVRQSNGVCWYVLEDHTGRELSGIWYYYQLNLVAKHADQS